MAVVEPTSSPAVRGAANLGGVNPQQALALRIHAVAGTCGALVMKSAPDLGG